MRFHWQNLTNEDEHGRGRGFPYHGRCWLWVGREDREFTKVQLEWVLGPRWPSVCFGIDEEDGLKFNLALGLFSCWLCIGLPWRWRQRSRELSLRCHSGSIWWTLWRHPDGEWNVRRSRWREGSFNVVDFLLGAPKHASREIAVEHVPLPLPEGVMKAKVTLTEDSWSRARWFTKRMRFARVEPERPAPVPGKGESGYDCGPDAIYSMSCKAGSSPEAIGRFVESVLRTRRNRGAAWDYAARAGADG